MNLVQEIVEWRNSRKQKDIISFIGEKKIFELRTEAQRVDRGSLMKPYIFKCWSSYLELDDVVGVTEELNIRLITYFPQSKNKAKVWEYFMAPKHLMSYGVQRLIERKNLGIKKEVFIGLHHLTYGSRTKFEKAETEYFNKYDLSTNTKSLKQKINDDVESINGILEKHYKELKKEYEKA